MGSGPVKPRRQLQTIVATGAAVASGGGRALGWVARRVARRAVGRADSRDGLSTRVELHVGDCAPDFRLEASDGRTYTLSQFTGRRAVVIAWFPKAFTGGCTAECESIGVSGNSLRQFQVAHFGASVDQPETMRRFAASMNIDFPILSDPDKTTASAYGVLGVSGFPARRTFVIGMDGRILAIDSQVKTSTHGPDLVSALTQLQIPRQA